MKKKSEYEFGCALKALFMLIGAPIVLVVGAFLVYEISEYYRIRMVRPIEWEIKSENLRGKKFTAEFIDMSHSSGFYPVERTFRIGETKNLVLPHTMYMFDSDSVKPGNISLKLDDPEFLEYQFWSDEEDKWIPTGKPVRFTVSEKSVTEELPAESESTF